MKITRISQLSGVERTLEISCTPAQYHNYMDGMDISLAMPNVPIWDREFIMTGVTKDEWDSHIIKSKIK
jgi:hypothetical protein